MPSRKKNVSTHYLAMWDMLGLECIFNITEYLKKVEDHNKKVMWNILKDSRFKEIGPPSIPIQHMILRAKVNSQRAYEIYEFSSTMTEKELRKEFTDNPQPVVDWIRENGHKVYSNYEKTRRKIIA